MASLLVKAQRKMSIAAHRKVRSALEGEYASILKGRSMDFDDLRQYVPNDDIKDIDWKATARSGQMLIKRYVAIRKYQFLIVADTGKSMAATAPSGEIKRDIAVTVAGVIAAVAQKHGDPVGMVAGDQQNIAFFPLKESRAELERMLQYMHTNTSLGAASSNLVGLLEYVKRNVKKRMMLIIISDNIQFASIEEQLLKRLSAQHELLYIGIDDLDPDDPQWNMTDVYDVERPVLLPKFIRAQKHIETAYRVSVAAQWKAATQTLERLRISSVRVDSEIGVVNALLRLLERHKHARR